MISIIIPIYNAEKWLKRCIESVVDQKNVDIELLLIDDGSTDTSPEICLEYAKKSNNIHYYSKENGGVSDTRNFGIEKAMGEWIVFVDSDDYLSDGILEKAEKIAIAKPQNMVLWNAAYIIGEKRTESPHLYGIDITKEDIIAALIYESFGNFFLGYYFRAVWGKIFRRDIIINHNIRFDTSLYLGEDAKFIMQYVPYIESVSIIDECGYNYYLQPESAVHRYKKDLLNQSNRQLEELRCVSTKYENSPAVQCAMNSFIWGTFNALVANSMKSECKRRFADAKVWYNQNKKLLRKNKRYTHRMSKFLKLEMWCSNILPIYLICVLAVLYEKRKGR